MINKKRLSTCESGFTLVELLVTIGIVGILASLALAAYDELREKVYITQTVQDFKTIETALTAMFDHLGYVTIPREGSIAGGGGVNPTIGRMTNNNNALGRFLPVAPIAEISTDDKNYRFDNDGDIYDLANCSGRARGVNIVITGVPLKAARGLDQIIDSGDGFVCGKLTWLGSGTLVYNILQSPTI